MPKSKPICSLFAVICVLAACGTTDNGQTIEQQLAERKYTLGGYVDRVEDYRIMGWNSLDNRHVIIQSSPKRSYLVTLRQPCYNLDTAETIAFSTTVGSMTRHDKIAVRSGARGYTEQCWIDSLQELNKVS